MVIFDIPLDSDKMSKQESFCKYNERNTVLCLILFAHGLYKASMVRTKKVAKFSDLRPGDKVTMLENQLIPTGI